MPAESVSMHTRFQVDQTAKAISIDLLASIKYSPEPFRPVPIRKLARAMEVAIVQKDVSPGRGALWARSAVQAGLFGDVEASIWDQSSGSRFTLAHELAHRASNLYISLDETSRWSVNDCKRFADAFAGYLLLPDALITASLGPTFPLHLTVSALKRMQRSFGISISCLLARLDRANHSGLIVLSDFALVAAPGISLRKGINFAPRIVASCSPSDWYIPKNKRLLSLGLRTLDHIFWTGPLFSEGIAEDTMDIYFKKERKTFAITRLFHYILFKSVDEHKVLVAIGPLD